MNMIKLFQQERKPEFRSSGGKSNKNRLKEDQHEEIETPQDIQ